MPKRKTPVRKKKVIEAGETYATRPKPTPKEIEEALARIAPCGVETASYTAPKFDPLSGYFVPHTRAPRLKPEQQFNSIAFIALCTVILCLVDIVLRLQLWKLLPWGKS